MDSMTVKKKTTNVIIDTKKCLSKCLEILIPEFNITVYCEL